MNWAMHLVTNTCTRKYSSWRNWAMYLVTFHLTAEYCAWEGICNLPHKLQAWPVSFHWATMPDQVMTLWIECNAKSAMAKLLNLQKWHRPTTEIIKANWWKGYRKQWTDKAMQDCPLLGLLLLLLLSMTPHNHNKVKGQINRDSPSKGKWSR